MQELPQEIGIQEKFDENGFPDATHQGYAFLNINNTEYNIDYKVAGSDPSYQMNIYAHNVVEHKGKTTSSIFVNFFMGSPNDKVEYRIDNGKWCKMSYNSQVDPSYYLKLIEWDTTNELINGRRPSNAVQSTHLWTGKIQLDLPKGEYTIEVRATDRYGKIHKGSRTYKIL